MKYSLRSLIIVVALAAVLIAVAGAFLLLSEPGAFHKPPDAAYYGENTALEFKQIIRGPRGSGADNRYGELECYYRVRGEEQYRTTKGVRKSADREAVNVEFTIPPVSKRGGDSGDSVLEYYVEGKFDGHRFSGAQNAENPMTIPLRQRDENRSP